MKRAFGKSVPDAMFNVPRAVQQAIPLQGSTPALPFFSPVFCLRCCKLPTFVGDVADLCLVGKGDNALAFNASLSSFGSSSSKNSRHPREPPESQSLQHPAILPPRQVVPRPVILRLVEPPFLFPEALGFSSRNLAGVLHDSFDTSPCAPRVIEGLAL